jgi:hypothetical protein
MAATKWDRTFIEKSLGLFIMSLGTQRYTLHHSNNWNMTTSSKPLVLQMLDIVTFASCMPPVPVVKCMNLYPCCLYGFNTILAINSTFSPTSIDQLDFMRGTQPVYCEVETGSFFFVQG